MMTDASFRQRVRWRGIDSFVGRFVIMAADETIVRAAWQDDLQQSELPDVDEDSRLLPGLVDRLAAYFDGAEPNFTDVPTPDGPSFFTRCWRICREIPAGTTITYGELAERASGDRRASRAAGQAMRRNPLPLIVPCHRVIATGGTLGGYAGCHDPAGRSLWRKRQLLDLEGYSADATASAGSLFQTPPTASE